MLVDLLRRLRNITEGMPGSVYYSFYIETKPVANSSFTITSQKDRRLLDHIGTSFVEKEVYVQRCID